MNYIYSIEKLKNKKYLIYTAIEINNKYEIIKEDILTQNKTCKLIANCEIKKIKYVFR